MIRQQEPPCSSGRPRRRNGKRDAKEKDFYDDRERLRRSRLATPSDGRREYSRYFLKVSAPIGNFVRWRSSFALSESAHRSIRATGGLAVGACWVCLPLAAVPRPGRFISERLMAVYSGAEVALNQSHLPRHRDLCDVVGPKNTSSASAFTSENLAQVFSP
jgi:hypothetical protein